MLPLEVRKYLLDITQACDLVMDFVEGQSYEDYAADPMLRSAVERQFEIVGEALKRMLELRPDLAARITGTRRIIAFRNRLIHAYASVADEVVWGVIEHNLPELIREARALLEEPIGNQPE